MPHFHHMFRTKTTFESSGFNSSAFERLEKKYKESSIF